MIEWSLVIAGIVGAILNILKNKWCFVIWGICNIGWVIFYINLKAYPQVILFGFYFLTTLWGLYQWYTDDKRNPQ
jgi:nicotinamide riboside transporter PnuC